jgi:hypothetical protein
MGKGEISMLKGYSWNAKTYCFSTEELFIMVLKGFSLNGRFNGLKFLALLTVPVKQVRYEFSFIWNLLMFIRYAAHIAFLPHTSFSGQICSLLNVNFVLSLWVCPKTLCFVFVVSFIIHWSTPEFSFLDPLFY